MTEGEQGSTAARARGGYRGRAAATGGRAAATGGRAAATGGRAAATRGGGLRRPRSRPPSHDGGNH